MRALLAGRLEDAEALAEEALAVGSPVEPVAAAQYYAIQLLAIRREQGRAAELEAAARAFVASNPGRPGWRAALIEILRGAGRTEEAQEAFDEFARHDFDDIPVDGDWLTAMVVAAEVAVGLHDEERAQRLYELLAPCAAHTAVVGLAAACLGPVAYRLGALAALLGRRDAAVEHFEAALVQATRIGAVIERAHVQLDYAALLGHGPKARQLAGAARTTAREYALTRVLARADALAVR
jgi:tetratricopeptide (TPR) repeat protein